MPYPDRVVRGCGAARLPLRQAPQEGRAQPHHLVQAAPRAAAHPRVLPLGRPGRHFPPPPNRKCRPGSRTRHSPAPSLSRPRPRPGVARRHGGEAGGLSLPPLRALLPVGEAPRGGRAGGWGPERRGPALRRCVSIAGRGGRGAGGPAGEARPAARQVRRAARPSALFVAVTGGGGGAGGGDRAGGGVPRRAGAVRQVRADDQASAARRDCDRAARPAARSAFGPASDWLGPTLCSRFPGFVLPCLGVHPVQEVSPEEQRSVTLKVN